MDNLTLGKMITLLLWAVTLPLWLPFVWAYRKIVGKRPPWNGDRGRPLGVTMPWMLIPFWMMGCGIDSPEAKVEKAEADLSRVMSTITKLGTEITKAEKAIADQKTRFDELKAKLAGLHPLPKPAPPNPAPSPGPAPAPGPQPPAPQPLPSPTEPDDGRFRLAKRIYAAALLVKTSDLRGESALLARNVRAVMEQIKDGKTDSILLAKQAYNISVALTSLNKPFTKAHPEWLPPIQQLGQAIEEILNTDGLIKTNQDWMDILDEVARPLEFLAK